MSSTALDILTLLDAYSQIHEIANQNQKNCTWQITKARQNKGRRGALVAGVLTAEDVREELRASAVLLTDAASSSDATVDPSSLVEEAATHKEKKADNNKPLVRQFVLTDIHSGLSQKVSENADKKTGDEGLRRRKGDKEEIGDTNKNEWTVVDPEKEEEERLLSADPLDLFGALPPQELRKAQEEARKALAGYVEAANLIAAIQERLPTQNS